MLRWCNVLQLLFLKNIIVVENSAVIILKHQYQHKVKIHEWQSTIIIVLMMHVADCGVAMSLTTIYT